MKLIKLLPFILIALCSCDRANDGAVLQSMQSDECRKELVGDCAWYAKCLETQYPCGDAAYAIGYGGKYCARFTAKQWVSPKTKNWVDKTRTCLQQTLIGYLDANPAASCSDIRRKAFDSHPGCYTSEPNSFCYLDLRDITGIYFTLDLRERFSGESLRQMKAVINQCLLAFTGRIPADSSGFMDQDDTAQRQRLFQQLLDKTEYLLASPAK